MKKLLIDWYIFKLMLYLILWLCSFNGTWQGTFTIPTVACDGSPEPGPLFPVLTLWRCDGLDTTFVLPSRMPGQDVPFEVTAADGHVYWVEARLKDSNNNLSCGYQSYMFTMPAVADTVPPPVDPPDTSATGITGKYYIGRSSNQWAGDWRDTTINFNWGNGSPHGLPVDEFSIEWIGKLVIPTTGVWTLFLEVDDGGQLYEGIPNPTGLLIDRKGSQPLTEWSWTGNLIAGEHGIVVFFQAITGNAQVAFKWQGPGVPKQVVPRGALR